MHLWFFTPTLYLIEITESNYSNNSFNCRFTEKLTYFDILHLKEIQKIFSNRYEITATRPINQSINKLLRAYSFFLPKINYQWMNEWMNEWLWCGNSNQHWLWGAVGIDNKWLLTVPSNIIRVSDTWVVSSSIIWQIRKLELWKLLYNHDILLTHWFLQRLSRTSSRINV